VEGASYYCRLSLSSVVLQNPLLSKQERSRLPASSLESKKARKKASKKARKQASKESKQVN